MSNSLIRAIKQQIADTLLGDPYFANIPVWPVVKNVVLIQIQTGQYEANPLTVLLDWLSVQSSNADTPGPWFNNGVFLAEVLEIPAMNDNGPDIDEVAENVANILHLAALDSQNVAVIDGITKADNDEFQRNSRLLRISFPFGIKPRTVPPIAPVVISPLTQGNQTVSLSCVTPGAAIFYTLDGSYPAPRNPSASLYSAPVSVAAGQLLSSRAWLASYAAAQPEVSQFQY